jgi:hypothetical protein
MDKKKISMVFPDKTSDKTIVSNKRKTLGLDHEYTDSSTSLKKLKKNFKVSARINQGLLPENNIFDIKYNFNNCKTKSQLDSLRRKESALLGSKFDFSRKSPEERINEREKLYCLTPTPGITYLDVVNKRKLSDFNNLINKFSKQTIGIHKNELPKFSKHLKLYWKFDNSASDPESTPKDYNHPNNHFRPKTNSEISPKPNSIMHDLYNYLYKSSHTIKKDKYLGAVKSNGLNSNSTSTKKNKNNSSLQIKRSTTSNKTIRSKGFLK